MFADSRFQFCVIISLIIGPILMKRNKTQSLKSLTKYSTVFFQDVVPDYSHFQINFLWNLKVFYEVLLFKSCGVEGKPCQQIYSSGLCIFLYKTAVCWCRTHLCITFYVHIVQ